MLAARDREILLELDAAYRNLTSLGLQGWCRPMDVGGVELRAPIEPATHAKFAPTASYTFPSKPRGH